MDSTVNGQVSGSPVDLLLSVSPVTWALIAAVVVLIATVFALAWLLLRARRRGEPGARANLEDWLTRAVAGIATGVSAQGMWRFAGDVLGMDGPLRLLLFAFIELAIVTSAVRAKRNMRENYSAGIDGIAVWAFAVLTAVLSSLDAHSPAEALFRLCSPLVAAWLWERGMAIERHRITGKARINWRVTPERVLVYLGLAEGKDRTASEVDVHRRLTRVALAAKHVRALREAGAKPGKVARALARLDAALEKAVEHTGLALDEALQRALLDETSTLYGAATLTQLLPVPTWARLAHPALPGAPVDEPVEMSSEARKAIDDYEEWKRPRFVPFPITRPYLGVTPGVTTRATGPEVTPWVTNKVADKAPEPVAFAPSNGSSVTPDVTQPATTERVTPEVTFDVTDPDMFDLELLLSDDRDVTPIVTPDVTGDRVTDDVTDEVTEDDPETQSKTDKMLAHWDAAVAEKRYPSVAELADVAGAHHSLASRRRAEWVAELPWQQRRKANPRREKASA